MGAIKDTTGAIKMAPFLPSSSQSKTSDWELLGRANVLKLALV
jgi:hypothetical protein